MMELVEAARHPDQGGDGAGGPQPGMMGPEAGGDPSMSSGMGPEAPPPMPPEEKIMQVAPDTPQERLPEYAAKLTELEQNVGMPVQDPSQITKFVAQMKKEDGKKIDEAIKQMGTQPPLTTSKQQPGGGESAPSTEAEKTAATSGEIAKRFVQLLKGGKRFSAKGNLAPKSGTRAGSSLKAHKGDSLFGMDKRKAEAWKSTGTRAATGLAGGTALYGGAKALGAGKEKGAASYGEEQKEEHKRIARGAGRVGAVGTGLGSMGASIMSSQAGTPKVRAIKALLAGGLGAAGGYGAGYIGSRMENRINRAVGGEGKKKAKTPKVEVIVKKVEKTAGYAKRLQRIGNKVMKLKSKGKPVPPGLRDAQRKAFIRQTRKTPYRKPNIPREFR